MIVQLEKTPAIIVPSILSSLNFLSMLSNLILKILDNMSGLSDGATEYLAQQRLTSGHAGLQVNVMKKSGYPAQRQIGIASWQFCNIQRAPPVKEEGRTIFFQWKKHKRSQTQQHLTTPHTNQPLNLFGVSLPNVVVVTPSWYILRLLVVEATYSPKVAKICHGLYSLTEKQKIHVY